MFDFTSQARTRYFVIFLKACFCCFLSFFSIYIYIYIYKKKKKKREKMQNFFFFLIAFQILHVFFPDISVHCAWI
jgi:uncharacterized membrane protein YhaH (DUF805 family)